MFGKGKNKRDRRADESSDQQPISMPSPGVPLPPLPNPETVNLPPEGPSIGGRIADAAERAPSAPSGPARPEHDDLSESAVAMTGINDRHPIDPTTEAKLAREAELGPDRPEVVENERDLSGSAAPGSHDGGNKVLGLINNIESQLDDIDYDNGVGESEQTNTLAELTERERRVEAQAQRNQRHRDKLEAAAGQLKQRRNAIREAEAQAAESQAILDRLLEQNRAHSEELAERSAEVEQRQSRLDDLETRLTDQQRSLGEQREAVRSLGVIQASTDQSNDCADRATCEERFAEARRQLDELRSQNESLQMEANEASAALAVGDETVKALRGEVETLQTALDRARKDAAENTADHAQGRAATGETISPTGEQRGRITELEESVAALRVGIEKRDSALRLLKGKLDETTAAFARAQQQPAGPADDTAAEAARAETEGLRIELEAARKEAADQAARADEMQRSAADRFAQQRSEFSSASEQLHAEREAIEQERLRLVAAERRVSAAGVRGKASVVVASFFVALAVTAAASWFISGEIRKPWFLATAELAADGGRLDEMTAEQRSSWQHFHESLLADPQMAGAIAERLKAQGFKELGSASDVRTLLEGDMDASSSEDGRLQLTLAGQGQDRTRRVLDTFASTMSRYANDARAGSIATGLVSPVSVTSDPIRDDRADLFVMVAGGGAAAVLLLWVVVWARLRNDKQAFEEQIMLGVEGLDSAAPISTASPDRP